MKLDLKILRMWEVLFPYTPAFWESDSPESENGWEPMEEKLGFLEAKMEDQVVSSCGVYLSHYKILVNVPCLMGSKQMWQDYYEITSLAYSPATREQPEDAEPYLISGHHSIQGAFLAFMGAEMDFKLQANLEARMEYEQDLCDYRIGG